MPSTVEGTEAQDFIVQRGDFSQSKFVKAQDPAATNPTGDSLGADQALIRVTKFAFTANNITYAVAGDMLSYWNFFPAEDGWGRIPVWGIGVVVQSNQEGMSEGDRFFGYFPMSTYLTVQPIKVSKQGFVDGAAHRQSLPPTYNQYTRMTPEAGFDPSEDDFNMLLRVLFMTSFVIDDFFDDNDFFGAKSVVISSASSKTSFGLAFLLSRRGAETCEVIGLTSPGNVDFVKGLGCYSKVVTYDDVASLDADAPTIFVDMAGNAKVLTAIHNHFGDQLKHSCMVGITHWQQSGRPAGLPGPAPQMFFAPTQIEKRAKDWGPGGLQQRFGKVWGEFTKSADGWINVVHGEGPEAVEKVYQETLAGKVQPDQAHVLSL